MALRAAEASTIFIAFGGYALLRLEFAAGFVLLIFAPRWGHFIEAKREGLNPSWPIFVPFVLACVNTRGATRGRPRVSRSPARLLEASPRSAAHRRPLERLRDCAALPSAGFVLDLLNLIPVGFFDGGAIWRSARWLRLGGGGAKATAIYVLYAGAVVFGVVGAWAAYFPQHRL